MNWRERKDIPIILIVAFCVAVIIIVMILIGRLS
jgi:hypothetical protein